MSGGTAQRDGSTLPPSVRFTASTDRLRAAIDNLDAAAKAELIFPDSPLGAWVAAQKDVLNALYVMEEGREEQLRMLIEGAKATAEAEAARAQAEVRKADQFIAKAEIELAQKQSESVKAIGDGIAARVVSMPCREWFDEQDRAYRDSVIPPDVKARVSVEAGVSGGWRDLVGDAGRIISINHYGASASGAKLFAEFGFSGETVAAAARESLEAAKSDAAPVHSAASGPKAPADLESDPGVTTS